MSFFLLNASEQKYQRITAAAQTLENHITESGFRLEVQFLDDDGSAVVKAQRGDYLLAFAAQREACEALRHKSSELLSEAIRRQMFYNYCIRPTYDKLVATNQILDQLNPN